MSDEEILKKAFIKIRNPKALFSGIVMALADYKRLIEKKEYYIIIFSHDFAKAFWGEELMHYNNQTQVSTYWWQVHLTRMVLEEEPLKYLERFLSE